MPPFKVPYVREGETYEEALAREEAEKNAALGASGETKALTEDVKPRELSVEYDEPSADQNISPEPSMTLIGAESVSPESAPLDEAPAVEKSDAQPASEAPPAVETEAKPAASEKKGNGKKKKAKRDVEAPVKAESVDPGDAAKTDDAPKPEDDGFGGEEIAAASTSAAPSPEPHTWGAEPGDGEYLKLDQIDPAPDQPRKNFTGIAELATNISNRAEQGGDGLIYAVLVRPKQNRYELVDGERRWRAKKLLAEKHGGPDTIRAVVRILSDREADEIRLVSVLQRADLTPLEEGEAFERMVRVHGLTADQLAARFGVSKRTVHARRQLLNLGPEARKALEKGEVNPSVAALISQHISTKEQALMLAALKEKGITTHEAAAELFREKFAYELKKAPFDTEDAFLTQAGPCKSCPHNSRNQQQLNLGERPATGGDICNFTACFQEKKAAHLKKGKEKAVEDGRLWLSADEAKKAFQGGEEVPASSDYVDLDAPCYALPTKNKQKSWRQLLDPKDMPPLYVGANARGVLRVLLKKDEAVAAALKNGTIGEKQAEVASRNPQLEQEKLEEENEIHSAVAEKVLAAGVTAAKKEFTPLLLRAMVAPMLETCDPGVQRGIELRGGRSFEQLTKELAKMGAADLRGLLYELVMGEYGTSMNKVTQAMVKVLKLDKRALEKEAKADRQKELDLEAAEKLMGKDKEKAATPPKPAPAPAPKAKPSKPKKKGKKLAAA